MLLNLTIIHKFYRKVSSAGKLQTFQVLITTIILETCSEIACRRIARFECTVCVNQAAGGSKTARILHASIILRKFVINFIVADDLWGFAELVVPILECQGYACHANANEDNNEHAANVLNRNAVRLILRLLALARDVILPPPLFLQLFQVPFVQQLQDAGKNCNNYFSAS